MHLSTSLLRRPGALSALLVLSLLPAFASLERAAAALKSGDLTQAESLLAPLESAQPPDAAALHLLSQLRLSQKRAKDAVALAERATAADPTRAEYFAQLGHACSQRIGEVSFMQQAMLSSKLRKAYEQCVKLDPANIDGLIGLTRFYSNAPEIAGGSAVRAREFATQIRELNPFLGELELGRIAERQKEPEVALTHYEAAGRLNPRHAGVAAACGRLLAQLGRSTEARQRFEAALALNPDHEVARKGLAALADSPAAASP